MIYILSRIMFYFNNCHFWTLIRARKCLSYLVLQVIMTHSLSTEIFLRHSPEENYSNVSGILDFYIDANISKCIIFNGYM